MSYGLKKIGRGDVGGKNASLGEMVVKLGDRGVRVPPGFATMADAYWRYIDANGLKPKIAQALVKLANGKATLADTGSAIRGMFLDSEWPQEMAQPIRSAYVELCKRAGRNELDVAVRSSVTAEDLPDASFAGQQETYLNIRGEAALLDACRRCYEYAGLIGGSEFEPKEENPMLGFRGASRYYSPRYREGFALECHAIGRLREKLGFTNVIVMIPFCRSTKEADRVLEVMAQNGLKRWQNGLEVYVMCEIPSNVILAREVAQRFDGFSIGSNDLTQLTLGVDRDSSELADLFDEQDEAVKWMIHSVIDAAHRASAKVGLCGQAPSDHPEFAEFLVDCGIDSISVSPDSFVAVKRRVAAREATMPPERARARG